MIAGRRVLLDANILIAARDPQATTAKNSADKARTQYVELLNDPNVTLAITPLIRYEVLRGVPQDDVERLNTLRTALNGLTEFDISRSISERAAKLFRHSRQQDNVSVDKRRFDAFHVATAAILELELMSQDQDISRLRALDRKIEDQS